jgi:hypothetical protein
MKPSTQTPKKPRSKPAHEEHYMQVAVIAQVNILCAMQRPDLMINGKAPVAAFCNSLPIGGEQGQRMGKWLNEEGRFKGIPDLCVFKADDEGRLLFVEMKTGKGVISDEQFETLQYLDYDGSRVAICRTVEEAVDRICKHLGLTARRI